MASVQLNAIFRDLKRHGDVFAPADVADDLFDIAADAILRQMDREQDPDGGDWPPLSADYEVAKQRIAPGKPMAVLYGHMKTIEQIKGQRYIGQDEARMAYGVDDLAKDLAEWFQEGNDNQPPRPFYAVGDEGVQLMDDYLGRRFASKV